MDSLLVKTPTSWLTGSCREATPFWEPLSRSPTRFTTIWENYRLAMEAHMAMMVGGGIGRAIGGAVAPSGRSQLHWRRTSGSVPAIKIRPSNYTSIRIRNSPHRACPGSCSRRCEPLLLRTIFLSSPKVAWGILPARDLDDDELLAEKLRFLENIQRTSVSEKSTRHSQRKPRRSLANELSRDHCRTRLAPCPMNKGSPKDDLRSPMPLP
jgi:hypothetical protein